MALTWFKNGNEYRTLDGRWTIWGDDRRGFTLDHTLDDGERISWSVPGAFNSVEEAKKQAERASQKSLPATGEKVMGRFNIDDKVRTRDVSHVPARYRNAEGVVSNHRYRGERITVKFPDGGEHWFYENELTPVTSAKSLLRAKYKAISKKSEVDKLREKMHRLNEKMKNSRAGTKVHKEAEAEYVKTADKIGQLLGYN